MSSLTRRQALVGGALTTAAGAMTLAGRAAAAQTGGGTRGWEGSYSGGRPDVEPQPPGQPGRDYTPVITPNGAALPFKIVNGVKVFHLTAEEVDHEFAPGLRAKCWGYNGRVHGPTIEAVEGDRVRIYVTNKLIAPTTIHWHGVFLPSGMDGVGGLSQRVIMPKETFKYEWTFRQHGTFMYHSHHDEMTQMALGLMGMLVVHPRRPSADYRVQRDFAMLLSEWSIPAGAKRPNPNEMSDFNVLTINAKAFPGTAPLLCKRGDRVRLRFGNLSAMDHHPIHLHGHFFKLVATDGGPVPVAGQWPETTVLVPVGSTRDVEFIADAPGDWSLHCHMTHHVMNQMGHNFPNMVGVQTGTLDRKVRKLVPGYMSMGQDGMGEMADMKMPVPSNSIPMSGGPGPFGSITMGGMFTIVKVRENLKSYDEDPGWYDNPPGTVADKASAEDLARDGINV
ncbi:multicopper oxidase family protein [Sorangium sp. So ce861]|uniref:multicopper oxidase family protein n=1 Tax=Sorangium sp. So ce861 TaxID=3133323 RepID=UPI003F6352CF